VGRALQLQPVPRANEHRLHLHKIKESAAIDITEFRSLIGNLRYLVNT
jgi:hypothetical protein